ncbi:hypothetical protein K9M18_00465 [Candidatus Woesearchaeota archaeon]|nr:hypothetical protein [Candidatus Woesearchaeota archaeon]
MNKINDNLFLIFAKQGTDNFGLYRIEFEDNELSSFVFAFGSLWSNKSNYGIPRVLIKKAVFEMEKYSSHIKKILFILLLYNLKSL